MAVQYNYTDYEFGTNLVTNIDIDYKISKQVITSTFRVNNVVLYSDLVTDLSHPTLSSDWSEVQTHLLSLVYFLAQ